MIEQRNQLTECPKYDLHVHTKYLGCGNATMEVAAIVKECERIGVASLAITDHLSSFDEAELHVPIRKDIERLETDIEVFFGAELNFTGPDEGFAFNEKIKQRYGFQFAIGGIHGTYLEEYDLKKLIDVQHRHHLKTCSDPLVEVLVHPYWFWKGEFDQRGWPWFDSMRVMPESYARELGQVAKETGTAIEINSMAHLANPAYSDDFVKELIEYLSIIAEEGAVFSVASDAHDIGHLRTVELSWRVAEQLNLSEDQIWRPACEPVNARK